MRIIKYTPDWYDTMRRDLHSVTPRSGLFHRPFVDYYYASWDSCNLFLALDDNDRVVGTYGVDHMRFEYSSEELVLGCGSNFYSLVPGVGALLFMQRLKDCPLGLVFGGSEDHHRVIASLDWTYFPAISRFHLNWAYPTYAGESLWRRLAKGVVRHGSRKKLGSFTPRLAPALQAGVSVHPEDSFSEDLIPRENPFKFRFAPDLTYLNWRYNTELSFVRYRIFRIAANQSTVGYVVINEKPDSLIVAHCDGTDPEILAYGVMLSILEVGKHDQSPRSVMLTSSHPLMQNLYRDFGFRSSKRDMRFTTGGYRRDLPMDLNTSNWLINFDWGDNGLCSPFLDQVTTAGDAGTNPEV